MDQQDQNSDLVPASTTPASPASVPPLPDPPAAVVPPVPPPVAVPPVPPPVAVPPLPAVPASPVAAYPEPPAPALVQPQTANTIGIPIPEGSLNSQPASNNYQNPMPNPAAYPNQTPVQNAIPNPQPVYPRAPGPNVMPGYNSMNVMPGYAPINTKPPRGKKIIIIVGVIALAAGIAALIFYFAYWTRADVVYSRFQNQIAKISTETLNTNIKLINDITYSLAVDSQNTDIPLKVVATGRIVSSGSENTADVTFSNATINLSANTINKNNSFDLFVKYKGIQKFYDSLLTKADTQDIASGFSATLSVLKKYDNKWISVDLSKTGLTSADTNESITQEDYNSVRDKLLPIFKDRFIGLKKSGAVIATSSPKTEKVAGKSAWAYEIKFNKNNFNAMLDEMIKAVDATKLSDSKKKILKESLDSQKDNSPGQSNNETQATTYRIWLEKNTGLPLKFSVNSENKYNGKVTSSSEFISEISSISSKNIIAKVTLSNKELAEDGSVGAVSVFSSNFNVDNKTTIIAVDAYYDPDISKDNDKISGKFQLSPASNKAPVTKPASTVTLEQVTDELNASSEEQVTNELDVSSE
ncbi:MAG: hypothetical protein WCN86_02865 [bacterium]